MRKRIARRIRKNIMRLGKITEERVLNRDDDGRLYPRKEWGYCIEAIVNNYRITAPDDSWYEAYKGCYFAAKWASEQEPFTPDESLPRCAQTCLQDVTVI